MGVGVSYERGTPVPPWYPQPPPLLPHPTIAASLPPCPGQGGHPLRGECAAVRAHLPRAIFSRQRMAGQQLSGHPLSSEDVTYKTVKAIFWPCLPGKCPSNCSSSSLFARQRLAWKMRGRTFSAENVTPYASTSPDMSQPAVEDARSQHPAPLRGVSYLGIQSCEG